MVTIRLTRVGKKKQAHYRVVVADSRKAVKAKIITTLGWYNPHTKELKINDKEELKTWLDNGAKPSNSMAKLLKKDGVKLPDWVVITEKKKKKKEKGKKEEASQPKPETKETEGGEIKEEKSEGKKEESQQEEKDEDKKEDLPEKGEAEEDVSKEEKSGEKKKE